MRYNKEIPKKIHSARQLSGFSPNLVHSIDAAMLMETVRRLQGYGIHSFSLIHDSYGTHAADIDKLHSVLRQVFYDIYKDGKFLEELKETMLSDRDIPEQGTLDISEVLVSKYFFN
jgi:DNA-directed RNA polymerase